MAGLFERLLWLVRGRAAPPEPDRTPPPAPPSLTDAQRAEGARLVTTVSRTAHYARIGGFRPPADDVLCDRWGGGFFGEPGAVPPKTPAGRAMKPVLQIRPPRTEATEGIALLTLWIHPDDLFERFDAVEGRNFAVVTHETTEGLVPMEDLPTWLPIFPMAWADPIEEPPSWEDLADRLPLDIAQAHDSDWFFKSEAHDRMWALRVDHPVKVGGWPQWVQGTQWDESMTFILQVDETAKGNLPIGDAGSFYLFRDGGGWTLAIDFH